MKYREEKRNNLKKLDISSLGLLIVLVILIAVFSITSPIFVKFSNIITILLSISVLGVAAAAQNIVVISGGIDLSQESVISASALVLIILNKSGFPLGVSIAAGIVLGAAIGWLNGILVTKAKINPLITTLATLGLVRGFAALISNGVAVGIHRDDFSFLARGFILYDKNIPLCVIILIIVFLIINFILTHTIFGRKIYAIGGNPQASMFAGINIDRNKIIIYVISGTFAAFSGIIFASIGKMSSAYVTNGYNINILTAVFLGGTALAGGRGRIVGTAMGVLIIGILNNGLQLLGFSANFKNIIIGLALILSVALNQARIKNKY